MRLTLPALPALPAVILLLALSSCRGSSGASDAPGYVMAELTPAANGDIGAVLKAEAAKAKALGLRPHVELWATWCGPCKEIKKSLGDARMQTAFKGTYIVQLDIDVWGAKLQRAGFVSPSIPVFFAVDDEGKPTGRKIDGGAWAENIPENMAPPLERFFHGA